MAGPRHRFEGRINRRRRASSETQIIGIGTPRGDRTPRKSGPALSRPEPDHVAGENPATVHPAGDHVICAQSVNTPAKTSISGIGMASCPDLAGNRSNAPSGPRASGVRTGGVLADLLRTGRLDALARRGRCHRRNASGAPQNVHGTRPGLEHLPDRLGHVGQQ